MKGIPEILEALRQCRSVLISVHKNPDGDALGSQLALMHALGKMGKSVRAHNLDPVPEIYHFLPGVDRITSGAAVDGNYDAFIVLDADPPRTGLFSGSYPGRTLINIDHHVTNPCEWPLTWLDPHATATGEMIFHLVNGMKVEIDRNIALCLYTAIFTDTGSFRYTNTTPASMRIAADLIEKGADTWQVTENVYESYTYRRVQLLGLVLSGIERGQDNRIASVLVTEDMYRKTGASAEDTDNFVNYVRAVKGVEVAILFRQTGKAQYKISLRSKGRVDLSAMAQSLGGGGHKNAAGGVLDGSFDEVHRKVYTAAERILLEQLGTPSAGA